jgi:DnaJ-class molecular chaperone
MRGDSDYVRVKCEHCDGTGKVPKRPGAFYSWKEDRRCKPRCSYCRGFGYIVTRERAAVAAEKQ